LIIKLSEEHKLPEHAVTIILYELISYGVPLNILPFSSHVNQSGNDLFLEFEHDA